MDEYLWPARNVAEYAYCPRLFYLMEVEGLHLPSADTEQGNAVHRRVNKPSTEDASPDPDKPQTVRSLTLTSPSLKLTATLDLAEITDDHATPVEYRKGRPRHIAPESSESEDEREPGSPSPGRFEPWPTDRVQVGLQAILLEEAGYTVPEAILYYAAIRQRIRVPVDAALRSEALATLRAAQQCAEGKRPSPLVNDARCAGCSLQPICLPDEVNQQRFAQEQTQPRRLWPPHDDALHIVAQNEGVKIGVSGMALKITDKEGTETRQIPLANVESLTILGMVQLSTQALHTLADRGIPVAFASSAGRLVTLLDPLDSVSAQVRRAQIREFDNPGRCLELARELVASKIANQRILLQRNGTTIPEMVLQELSLQIQHARSAASIDALLGHEG